MAHRKLLGFLFWLPGPILAQEPTTTLPAVEVTARRDATIDKPVSITRLTGDELEKEGVEKLTDLQSRIPNFIGRSGGTRSLNNIFGMRGLVNNFFNSEPAVGLYVDDIPYGNVLTYDTAILDIDRMDVYRGPQFTRFGRRGATGMISIYSREPGDRLTVEGSANYAENDEQQYKLSLQTPLGPQFSFSLSGMYARRDGYMFNETLHRNPDSTDAFTGRFSFQWTPTPEWKVQLIVAGQRFDDGAQRFTNVDSSPYVINHDFAGDFDGTSDVEALRIRYADDQVRFLSVTARRSFTRHPSSFDGDFTPNPRLNVTINSNTVQYSQEFRLESVPGGKLDWFVGAFLSWTEQDSHNQDTAPSSSISKTQNKAAALYGEATRKFGDLDVTVGLRGDVTRKSIQRHLNRANGEVLDQKKEQTISNVSPRLQLTWHFNDAVFAYANTALSYRPGVYSNFNSNLNLDDSETERNWASEIGAKARLFNDKLELSIAGYWYEIENYQLERYLATGFIVVSADHATARGVELEVLARPAPGLQLSAALGYTYARFTEHSSPTGVDLSDNPPPYIPDLTASFGAQYRHSSGFMGRVDWILTGRTYFDEAGTRGISQNAYGLLNARIGYEASHWGLYVYGDNLTNTKYYPIKLSGTLGITSEPRSVGVLATFKF
jgi:iron complex outermembrane receptor protein